MLYAIVLNILQLQLIIRFKSINITSVCFHACLQEGSLWPSDNGLRQGASEVSCLFMCGPFKGLLYSCINSTSACNKQWSLKCVLPLCPCVRGRAHLCDSIWALALKLKCVEDGCTHIFIVCVWGGGRPSHRDAASQRFINLSASSGSV